MPSLMRFAAAAAADATLPMPRFSHAGADYVF